MAHRPRGLPPRLSPRPRGGGRILRIAPVTRLAREQEDERRLAEARTQRGQRTVATFHLSYARAEKMAEIAKRLLPGAEVAVDARTNTLIVID